MRYLLDTNALISILNDTAGCVAQRLKQYSHADIGLSSIVINELYYGAFKSKRRDRNLAIVESLQFEIISFDPEDARHAGEIRAQLANRGTPIGSYDLLIAGQARSRGLILVTRNMREFQRVPELHIENWEES